AEQIIVIGAPENRLAVAQQLGATDILALSETTVESRRDRVMELTGGRGADTVIEAAGHPSAFPEGLELVGRNGSYLILGLYSGQATLPVDVIRLNNYSQRIIGSLGNQLDDYRRAVGIAASHGKRL